MSEKKILLRLDAETYNKVHKQSKKENRSINGELVNIIQKSFNSRSVTISGEDIATIINKPKVSRFQQRLDDYMNQQNEGK